MNPDDVARARELGINLSQACGRGLAEEIRRVEAQLWREQNPAAIISSNSFVEAKGLPLAAKRLY